MISLEAALQSGILWYPSVKQKVFISRKIYLFQKSGLPLQLRFSNLAMKNPKMMSSCFIFIYEQCLFTTTSWEDLAAVVFVSNKFMSIFLLCNFPASLFRDKKKCITFRLWAYFIINLFCKGGHFIKIGGGHFIQIGYFPTQTNLWSFSSWMSVFTVPCYQRSLTTRQKWEKGERLPFVSFLPRRERPLIAGNLCGRLFKDSGSNYLRNIFTALAVGLSGEAKFQKC